MTLEQNTHHAEDAVLKFAAPFWGKPRWAALCTSIAIQIQALEDAIFDVIEKRMLPNATGAQLVTIGRIVGQLNPGVDEDTYRDLIKVCIRINRSEATLKDFLDVLELLGSTATVSPMYPAAVRVDVPDQSGDPEASTLTEIAWVFQLLSRVVAAGVGLSVVQAEGFAWSGETLGSIGSDWAQETSAGVGDAWGFVLSN